MGVKRPRTSKRTVVSSEEEEADTFINNSDFLSASSEQEEPSSTTVQDAQKFQEDDSENPFDSDNEKELKTTTNKPPRVNDSTASIHDSILETGIEDDILETGTHDDARSNEHNDSVKEEADEVFENAAISHSKSDTSIESEGKSANTSIVKLEAPSGNLLLSPSTADSKDSKDSIRGSTLSFSQQTQLQLQSPSKRRDVVLPSKKNEPRLVINKLVLTNFKSYAGKQVIGPFNASFSAVVGPNGSGKSNVIDSLLFVFGFRASKMRQGKLSELIHNSTSGEKLDYCQVDIHFQHVLDDIEDEKKADVIPDSDSGLVISRKATKANQSSYYINGSSSNYTEVTSFLRDKGIDLDHKRFLILQGEVESIAQMKAKAERENDDGLLEYLEDIIGTSKYKSLIEESLTKVDELNEVCVEKENRFELVEKDKDSLEDKKTEALKFLEFEKKLINKQSIQYQVSIYENEKIIEDNETKATALNDELKAERSKNAELVSGVDEYLKQQEIEKESITEINKKISLVSKKQKETNKQTVTLEEKTKNLVSKSKKIKKTKETSEHALSSSTAKLQNSNNAALQFKTEMETLDANLEIEKAKLDEIRKGLTAKTSEFTKEIGSLQTKLEPWNDKLKQTGNALTLAVSELGMVQSQKENISKQLDESKARLIAIKKEGKSKEAEYLESQEKLNQIIEQISLGEEQVADEREQLESKRSQLLSTRQKTQDAINSLNNHQNKNKVLSSLLRLAKSGRIEGFYGRLGDLGVIDDIYDVAISTACPGLDSMVVESVETAQSCIDYLRKNKLGYANFICLNKLRQFNLSPIQTPGNPAEIKRLFDLIRPQSPKFAPAFYSKLYNTLVAPDLKEAKKVAYGAKRWKVVTLDGKVVDTSGTMSGGGNYFAKGGMRLSNSTNEDAMDISPEDVDQLREDLRSLEAKFEIAENEFKEKVSMLKKLQDLKPETEFSISRLRLDIESLSTEKREVTLVCKNLIAENENNDTSKQFDEQIEKKTREISQLEAEKNHLKSQMTDLEGQIKVLEEKIMDAGGVELKVQNSKVDSIKQQMEIITEKTSSDRMAIRKLENDVKRHTKIIEQSAAELESTESELETIQTQLRETSQQLNELQSTIVELENSRNEHESTLENIHTQLEEKNEEINKFKSIEIDIQNKLEKYNVIIKKAQRYIASDQENLEGLVVRDPTEYIDWMEEEEQTKYNGSQIETIDVDAIDKFDLEEINSEIEVLQNVLNNIKVDIEVLKEYGAKKTEFESRKLDLNSAVEQRDEIKNYCEDLKRKRLDEFMEGFNTISMTLKDMYRMITMGGNAELELVDSLDPFSEGILFSVMPPKKSWKNISNLSGGEKTLSSLALVFALHQYKPTPLYVMDEIDAALDFRNVSIVANYIKERTKNAQFIVISLRNNMFELAQQLVGIYKINNKTKSISLQNRDFLGNEV